VGREADPVPGPIPGPLVHLPYLGMVAGYGALLLSTQFNMVSPGLVAGAIALTVVVLGRQEMVLRQNSHLLAQQARRESEARFRALAGNASDAIVLVDADAVVHDATESSARVLGLEPSKLVGRTIVRLAHADDARDLAAYIADCAARRPTVGRLAWRLWDGDGAWRQVETIAANLIDDPRIGRIVLTTRDVRDRFLVEEQLRRVTQEGGRGVSSGNRSPVAPESWREAAPSLSSAQPTSRPTDTDLRRAELRRAAASGGLRIAYEPVVELGTGHIALAGARGAWISSSGSAPAPVALADLTAFVAAAGPGDPLEAWILRTAAADAASWARAAHAAVTRVAIRLQPDDLADANLPWAIQEALGRAGASPSWLCLEVSAADLAAIEGAADRLRAIGSLGVALAVADADEGPLRLGDLERLRIGFLDISRRVVQRLGDPTADDGVARAVVAVGQCLGVPTIAEGVDSRAWLDRLASIGCAFAHGPVIGEPLDADEMRALVSRPAVRPLRRPARRPTGRPAHASMIGTGRVGRPSRRGERSDVAASITHATPTRSQAATTKLPVASRTAPSTTGPTAANV
jgi:PAS domain S-box-containing protein